jgi:hypothetical protein
MEFLDREMENETGLTALRSGVLLKLLLSVTMSASNWPLLRQRIKNGPPPNVDPAHHSRTADMGVAPIMNDSDREFRIYTAPLRFSTLFGSKSPANEIRCRSTNVANKKLRRVYIYNDI